MCVTSEGNYVKRVVDHFAVAVVLAWSLTLVPVSMAGAANPTTDSSSSISQVTPGFEHVVNRLGQFARRSSPRATHYAAVSRNYDSYVGETFALDHGVERYVAEASEIFQSGVNDQRLRSTGALKVGEEKSLARV